MKECKGVKPYICYIDTDNSVMIAGEKGGWGLSGGGQRLEKWEQGETLLVAMGAPSSVQMMLY